MSHQTVAEALRIATVGDTDAASANLTCRIAGAHPRELPEEDARNDLEVPRVFVVAVQSAAGTAVPL